MFRNLPSQSLFQQLIPSRRERIFAAWCIFVDSGGLGDFGDARAGLAEASDAQASLAEACQSFFKRFDVRPGGFLSILTASPEIP